MNDTFGDDDEHDAGGASERAAKGIPRILVVDDEPANLRLLEAILVPEGYETVTAESGQQCLDKLAAEPFDLVVLDVLMPGMDGIQACEKLKADARFSDVPVVFVTALTDRESRIRGKAAGGDDFLAKPVDELELITRVHNLVKVKAYHDLQRHQRELLERALAERTRELLRAERLATLGSLASGVAHELGNVGSALNGTIALIEVDIDKQKALDPELLQNLKKVASHLSMHARHLLRLGQPGPDREERIELVTAVEATVALLLAIGKTTRVKVEARVPRDPVWVMLNGTRLEQVLMNLVLNAVHATVEAKSNEPVRIEVMPADASGRVRCRVVDRGTGIPKELLSKVMEPYFTTKPAGKGTGLGLTVVRQIVEGYGGHVSIASEPGEGTSIEFDLPATNEPM